MPSSRPGAIGALRRSFSRRSRPAAPLLAVILLVFSLPANVRVHEVAKAVPGDSTIVFGPTQFVGKNGQGNTYVEQFTVVNLGGQDFTLKLVNGAPDGTHRASKVIIRLNGYEIVSQNEVTQSVGSLTRPVAVTAVDTIRITVAGSGSPHITLSIVGKDDGSFPVHGPNDYVILSGSSRTVDETFPLPADGFVPHRVFVTNGAPDGTRRATSASVRLNGTTIVTTSEMTSAVGSLTKVVSLLASNDPRLAEVLEIAGGHH